MKNISYCQCVIFVLDGMHTRMIGPFNSRKLAEEYWRVFGPVGPTSANVNFITMERPMGFATMEEHLSDIGTGYARTQMTPEKLANVFVEQEGMESCPEFLLDMAKDLF